MFGFDKKQNPVPDENKVDEILSRGVVEVIDKENLRKKMLSGKALNIKLGIDPTGPMLHLGHSVNLLKLRDFQELGHKVIFIIGDATGVIGDTSDTKGERPMLEKGVVKKNKKNYIEQVGKILNIKKTETRNNSEWLHRLGYSEIGEQADQFSVAGFTARENIKRRLDKGVRVSLREVLYPLMQGYDSVAIKADVELGGTDQRFNLLAGRTLQEHYGQEPQDVLITEIVEGTDGEKMSKSVGNTINLTDEADDMYGKIMSIKDDLTTKYFTLFTRVPTEEIEKTKDGVSGVAARDAKMKLAKEITKIYHGERAATLAEKNFVEVFQKRNVPEEMEEISVESGSKLNETLLSEGIVQSKGEFRRLVEEGAVVALPEEKKISDPSMIISKTTILRVGKKTFVKIVPN